MDRKYSEVDLTWSSVENHYDYSKVVWHMRPNGIPVYTLFDKDNKKIEI